MTRPDVVLLDHARPAPAMTPRQAFALLDDLDQVPDERLDELLAAVATYTCLGLAPAPERAR